MMSNKSHDSTFACAGFGAMLVAMVLAFLEPISAAHAATTWNVSPGRLGACTVADPNCANIQAAVDAASTGDTINVFPGTYNETAPVPSPPGCTGDTVGLYISNGITIQGVDGSGNPITDYHLVAATVNTVSNLCFGPDGIFVVGDNVTIAGLRIGTNTGGQNKTIEVVGDNFTLKDCDVADLQGSVYVNDFNVDTGTIPPTSHVQRYRIEGNNFQDGVSLDIASGAGLSGPVSGRVITGNTFNNLATAAGVQSWPSISFSGSGTGVPWFVYSVGGAVITGNVFNNSAPDGQHIRARGTYDNTQFDWASYWTSNTYTRSAIVGPTPPSVVETYSYPNSYGTFDNVRRIGASIQGEVGHAQAADTVLVGPGTYAEQVVVNKSLALQGAGAGSSIVQAPATLVGDANGAKNVVTISGLGVNAVVSGFSVTGPGPSGCGSLHMGIFVRDGASADIHDNTIADIRDNPLSGCQNGAGIFVGRKLYATTGTATITNNLISGYQKGGIVVDNAGSSATIVGNTVTGVGATPLIAQNGIQVSRGAVATVSGNVISGNLCDHVSCGPNPLTDDSSAGVLLYQAGAGTMVSGNPSIASNDIGVYNLADGSTISGNQLASNRYEGIFIDQGGATVSGNTIQGGNIGLAAISFTGSTGDSAATLTCNRISGAGTGIEVIDQDPGDAYSPVVAAHSNAIDGNGAGIVNTSAGAVAAENNWWGCVSGPGAPGCDTVSGNVTVVPVASGVPGCVYCSTDAECSDGIACNGAERCSPGTHTCGTAAAVDCSGLTDQCNIGECTEPVGTCVAQPRSDGTACSDGRVCTTSDSCQGGVCVGGPGLSCTLGSADPTCNEAVCVEPGGCAVQPKPAGTICECGLTSCPASDQCDGTGICLSTGSMQVSEVRLRSNTRLNLSNGSVSVVGTVDDGDTGGLKAALVGNTVSIQVSDGGAYNTTLALSGCALKGTVQQPRVQCVSADRTTMARFTAVRGQPNKYRVRAEQLKLGTAQTGYQSPRGPVMVALRQGAMRRGASISTCSRRGDVLLICRTP